MITIAFKIDSPYGVYFDAIVLLDGQTMTNAQIESMKQARYEMWLAAISAPSADEEVSNG
jgi:hypothetical protein